MMKWTPDKIKLLRKHLGFTQEQFAERLGYSRRETIAEFESGKHAPNAQAGIIMSMLAKEAGFGG